MALYMVTNDLTPAEVLDPAKEINFPESVISLFRGEMGYPADGFPKELGKKILKDKVAIDGRAGAHLPPVDLEAAKKEEMLIFNKDEIFDFMNKNNYSQIDKFVVHDYLFIDNNQNKV
jgi:pyruvate carboxylase